jgi:hypothetical protein
MYTLYAIHGEEKPLAVTGSEEKASIAAMLYGRPVEVITLDREPLLGSPLDLPPDVRHARWV